MMIMQASAQITVPLLCTRPIQQLSFSSAVLTFDSLNACSTRGLAEQGGIPCNTSLSSGMAAPPSSLMFSKDMESPGFSLDGNPPFIGVAASSEVLPRAGSEPVGSSASKPAAAEDSLKFGFTPVVTPTSSVQSQC